MIMQTRLHLKSKHLHPIRIKMQIFQLKSHPCPHSPWKNIKIKSKN